MHKAVILLTKASSREEALNNSHNFLKNYEHEVWDWYAIGGRWNNTLAPRAKEWREYVAEKVLSPDKKHGFISQRDIEVNQDKLQQVWKDLGMQGLNPYCNHYKLPDEGNIYDVVTLKECLHIVSEWTRDMKEVDQKHREDLEHWKDDPSMIEYLERVYRTQKDGEFSFESNVYNIDTNESERIPNNLTHYWAVMVDMHN